MTSPGPTLGQRRLARALRKLRTEAGLTIEQVAEKLDLSPSTVSRMETAQAGVRRPDVRELLDLYEVTGTDRQDLLQLVEQSRKPPWWQAYRDLSSAPVADLEAEAASISQYSALLIPGLLQTEAYAREILSTIRADTTPDPRRLELRMNRQGLLTDPKSPKYELVVDEAVLRRIVGGPQAMQAQLERLVQAASLPNVTLQILPFSAGAHPGLDGEFTIFRYSTPNDPDVVYIETAGGDAYIEDRRETGRYKWIFDCLRKKALDPEESVQQLKAISVLLPTH